MSFLQQQAPLLFSEVQFPEFSWLWMWNWPTEIVCVLTRKRTTGSASFAEKKNTKTRKKSCDLEFATSKRSDLRFHSTIFLRIFCGTCSESCDFESAIWKSRAAKGGVSNGGVSRSGLVLPFLSFLVLFGTFPIFFGIFPICTGMVRGFSWFVLFLFLSLLRAPTRNSPERVRDTIWTFPEKSGKHPGLETPRFSFSQENAGDCDCDFLGR